jgi:hypothetical protein
MDKKAGTVKIVPSLNQRSMTSNLRQADAESKAAATGAILATWAGFFDSPDHFN